MSNIYVFVDVEADGPAPGTELYSMIALGAVAVIAKKDVYDLSIEQSTFLGYLKPISEKWRSEALAVSGYSREKTLTFPAPIESMHDFISWLDQLRQRSNLVNNRLIFVSDNNGFDWQFVNWYFWKFCNQNPFGHSSMNLNYFYKGLCKNIHASFKHLRVTKHDHNPVNDARGNAEAFISMIQDSNARYLL